jgi:hypothetical protein
MLSNIVKVIFIEQDMLRFWFEYFGKGNMYLQFMLFRKCK